MTILADLELIQFQNLLVTIFSLTSQQLLYAVITWCYNVYKLINELYIPSIAITISSIGGVLHTMFQVEGCEIWNRVK